MIVLGIDPGTAITGYAVLDVKPNLKTPAPKILEVDCVKTPAGMEMSKRLKILHDNLGAVMDKYSPDIMVIEKLFFNTNVKTAMSVGQARGIPLLLSGHRDIQVCEYTALQAKKSIAGHGRADKKQMQLAIKEYMMLDEIIKSDDANDAVAMALCFLQKDFPAYLKKL